MSSSEIPEGPAPAPASENILHTVWALAWPAVALNGLQTVNSLLDSNFVQHLEQAALTAIGSSLTTVFLFFSMSMAVGVAATAMVSRAYGAGDDEGFREANRRCLGFSVAVGVVLAVLAFLVAPSMTTLFVPAGEVRVAELMTEYIQIFALLLPAVFVIQTLAGSLRGVGDTKSPMVVSGAQILLHIVLNVLLIFEPRVWNGIPLPGAGLGLAGAAWAMTISGWISAAVYLVWCTRTPLGEVWRIKMPGFEWTKRIYRLAMPAGLMSLVRVTSLMVFTWILTKVPNGEVAIGAMRPGFSIESLAFMPSFGLAIAASALVGQSLGMNDPERARRLGWMAGHMAGVVSLVAAVLIFVFAPQLAAALLPDQPEFAATTASYLRFVSVTEVFFGYGMVLISAQQGAGDTRTPFWVVLFSMWLLRVPLAAFLALEVLTIGPITLSGGLGMGSDGCWLSLAITQLVQGVLAMVTWGRGRWRSAEV